MQVLDANSEMIQNLRKIVGSIDCLQFPHLVRRTLLSYCIIYQNHNVAPLFRWKLITCLQKLITCSQNNNQTVI